MGPAHIVDKKLTHLFMDKFGAEIHFLGAGKFIDFGGTVLEGNQGIGMPVNLAHIRRKKTPALHPTHGVHDRPGKLGNHPFLRPDFVKNQPDTDNEEKDKELSADNCALQCRCLPDAGTRCCQCYIRWQRACHSRIK